MEDKNIKSCCEGCHYWRDVYVCYACHYLLVTGKRRGCSPGADCTKRIPMDTERMLQENRRMFVQGMRSYAGAEQD